MNHHNDMIAASRQLRITFATALIAGFLSLVFNLYHFSLQGTGGLYTWHPLPILTGMLFMGLVPLGIAILYFFVFRVGPVWLRTALHWLSLLISAMVSLVSVALLVYLIFVPRLGKLEIPQLSLINPEKGIEPIARIAESSAEETASPLLRLSFTSDPHWGAETSNAEARTSILKNIARHQTDAFFMLGDTVETGNVASMWQAALTDLGTHIPQVPLRVLLGNHDALFGGQYLYTRAFAPREIMDDSGSPFYWSLNLKAATIVAINLPWGTENFGNRQRRWLEKTLAAADSTKPIIVLSHSYFYASGYDDPANKSPWYDHYQNLAKVAPLLEQYKVTLVISGHNHYQELLFHNGVTYALVGSMGGIPDPKPAYVSPASQWIAVGQFGWLDVDLFKDRLHLVFRNENGVPQYIWDVQTRTN
ncbi:metallophosphoesterase family protein [Gracilinema caldarium]|uniref:Metallophosphoesterase n=1 Tax=Gracilinema caldarium (strain ATCC 51460 / DSM 7334 / H1) TaxID=744872 RepID=F8EYV2_GRAC1|nr:metallophosphoesterase [Gracilinema caldarium]AEJ18898.1 metallophosphoesterase [Gracilinema caldarium DSM 7334]